MSDQFHFKSSAGTIKIDEAKGIVECFVAAIGNKDSVNDIILPGAFTGSLKKRTPRVVWGHNWNEPVGKVLYMEEVKPGDSRLPAKMAEAGVGGLLARVQFNLNSERGKQAFADVAFFGEDQEWSIGYKTIRSSFDPNRQANLLQEVELYEVSPVLHGANRLTGTISVKGTEVDYIDTSSSGQPNVYVTSGADTSASTFSSAWTGWAHAWNPVFEKGSTEEGIKEEPLTEEKVAPAAVLAAGLRKVMGLPVSIRGVGPGEVIFDVPEKGLHAARFRMEPAKLVFSRPKRVRLRMMVEPIEASEEAASTCLCGDGCGGRKDLPGNESEKAGRVLSTRNLEKLRQAIDMLNQILSGASPEPSRGIEQKENEE